MNDKDKLIRALLTGNTDVITSMDTKGDLQRLVKHLQDTGFYATSHGALHPQYPRGYV